MNTVAAYRDRLAEMGEEITGLMSALHATVMAAECMRRYVPEHAAARHGHDKTIATAKQLLAGEPEEDTDA